MSRKGASHLDPEILGGHEFQLEFLADRLVITATFGKSSGRLALEFVFTDAAYIRTDHETKQMLGVDAFSMNPGRKQRRKTRYRSPKRFCINRHSHSENRY